MAQVGEDFLGRANLADRATMQRRDPFTDHFGDNDVVADEKVSQFEFALSFRQQVQNLRPDRDIQSRDVLHLDRRHSEKLTLG